MAMVDIVLPVRDGAATISDAVQSLLEQTFTAFKLIVVDDGSIDETPRILSKLAAEDDRIQIVKGCGQGIVAALNLGISSGHAPLIARMDADDIAFPERLEMQVATFDKRPKLVLLGTGVEWFGSKMGRPGIVQGVRNCRTALGLFTPFCHPSVMLRRSALGMLDRAYDAEFEYSEDWEFFSRLSGIGDVDNLNKVLLRYRVHDGQVSHIKRSLQVASHSRIALKHQREILGMRGPVSELLLWADLLINLGPENWRQIARAIKWRLQGGKS